MRLLGFEGWDWQGVACRDDAAMSPSGRWNETRRPRRASFFPMGWFALSKQLMRDAAQQE